MPARDRGCTGAGGEAGKQEAACGRPSGERVRLIHQVELACTNFNATKVRGAAVATAVGTNPRCCSRR